jgi:winged helix-turn helix protein
VAPLVISDGQREVLETLASSRAAAYRAVQRAQVLLLAADGVSNSEISEVVGVSRPTVLAWRGQFEKDGLSGFGEVAKGRGRKPSISNDKVAEIVDLTLHSKPEGETHWSCRSMATRAGMSSASVQRIWSARGLKPHLVKTFTLSNDRHFEEKFIDVVGLYLNPVVLQNGFTGFDLGAVGWLAGGAVLGVVAFDPGWGQGSDCGVVVGGELVAALVWSVVVEVVGVVAEDLLGVAEVEEQDPVGAFLAYRAHEAFRVWVAVGLRGGVLATVMASLAKTASNAAVNLASRSRIRNRNWLARSPISPSNCRACWATHAAVGWAVTPRMCTL